MTQTFEYDLLQCEERTWHSWENFTETLTQDFKSFRQSNPDVPVKIIFNLKFQISNFHNFSFFVTLDFINIII